MILLFEFFDESKLNFKRLVSELLKCLHIYIQVYTTMYKSTLKNGLQKCTISMMCNI